MRMGRARRSTTLEVLEDRSVPSHFGLGFAFGHGFGGGHAPSVPAQDAGEVQQAFQTFQNTYNQDYRNVLYGASTSGTISPTANRSSFNQDIDAALATLSASIAQDVANLPSGTTLAATINAELVGSASTSLQSELTALPTPTGVFTASARSFLRNAQRDTSGVEAQVTQQVRTAAPPSGGTTSPPGGTTTPPAQTTQSLAYQDIQSIRQAFGTFQRTYNSDVQTVLYAAGSGGTINPTANRASFNTQVDSALTTLSTSIGTALGNLPSNSTLVSQVQSNVVGSASNSLQSQLAALPTPTGVFTPSMFLFRSESTLAINIAQSQVDAAILAFVQNS